MSETATAPAPAAAGILSDPAPAAPAPERAAPEWLASLPEDLRSKPSLSKFQDPVALAKSYTELEGLIGRKGLVAPKEGDPPEVTAAWREALGVPEEPAGYEIKPPEGTAPEHWNDDTTTVLRGWAHELGLTPQQAQGLAERYAGMLSQAAGEQFEAMETALRKDWGAAYDVKTTAAAQAAREFLSPETREALKAAGLAASASLIRDLAAIGEKIGGHDGTAGMNSGGGALTPAAARAQAQALRAHPGYFDSRHPEHRALVQRAVDLEKMAMVGQG